MNGGDLKQIKFRWNTRRSGHGTLPWSEQEVAIAVNDNLSVNSSLTVDETLPLCKDDVGCDLVKSLDGENALDICARSRLSISPSCEKCSLKKMEAYPHPLEG
jgi:hypothetical protein